MPRQKRSSKKLWHVSEESATKKTLQQSTIHFSCTNHKPSPYLLCENKECDLSIDPRGFDLSIVPIGLEYLSLGSFGKVNLAGQGVQDV